MCVETIDGTYLVVLTVEGNLKNVTSLHIVANTIAQYQFAL
jgi:hypothetical protein